MSLRPSCCRFIFIFLAVSLSSACDYSNQNKELIGINNNEMIFAVSSTERYLFESYGDGIEIYSEDTSFRCEATPRVIGRWNLLREVIVEGPPERRKETSLNPNRFHGGCTVAFAVREREEYEIWYVGDSDLKKASVDLASILNECGTGLSFSCGEELHVLRRPSRETQR